MTNITRIYEDQFQILTNSLRLEPTLNLGYSDWVALDDLVRDCAHKLMREIEDNTLLMSESARQIYMDKLLEKFKPHGKYDQIQAGIGWELVPYNNLPEMLRGRKEFQNPFEGKGLEEPDEWSTPEDGTKVRRTIEGTAGVGALLIINNYRRAVSKFITDEISRYSTYSEQSENDTDDLPPIIVEELQGRNKDNKKFLILKEFGFIDDLRGRVELDKRGASKVAGIIASLLELDRLNKEDKKRIDSFAKRYSQYGKDTKDGKPQSNDPIKSDSSVNWLDEFLAKYNLKAKRVFRRKK